MKGSIIFNKRKSGILLALCAALIFSACQKKRENPAAVRGTIDLSGWDFRRDGPVSLNGSWLLVRDRLISPDRGFYSKNYFDSSGEKTEEITVPGKWNKRIEFTSGRCPGDGFGTYLLRIKNIDTAGLTNPSLLVRNISSAYRLYVLPGKKPSGVMQGIPASSGGEVGLSREETRPGRRESLSSINVSSEEIILLLQTANFHHYYGGIFKTISFGNYTSLDRNIHYRIAVIYFTLGVFIIMGFYYGQIFLQRRHEYSSLVISLLCLVFAIRLLATSGFLYELSYESSPLFFETILKIDVFTFFAGVPLFYHYFWLLYPDEFSRRLRNIVWGSGAAAFLPVLFLPFRTSFLIVEAVFILSFILVGYIFISMGRAIRHRRQLAWISMAGLVFLVSAVLPDFIAMQNLVMVPLFIGYGTASYGLLAFIYIQNSILSKRFTDMQRRAEDLNVTLEQRVQERTGDLETVIKYMADANVMLTDLSIMDGLTGVKNRSFFNERIQKDWNNALRNGNFLSLLMIDIDHFKSINDTFGHQAGDECLKQVARIIRTNVHRPTDSVSRYGGEEFSVTLNGTAGAGAFHVAEWVRKEIESEIFYFEEKEITMTVSIGVASMIPDEINNYALLVAEADRALYEAKSRGRNRVVAST